MKLVVGFIAYQEASLKYLEHFLPSLKTALSFLSASDYQVMTFDNSPEGDNRNRLTLEYFHHQEGWPFTYYALDKNLGFGTAYNILIKKAKELGAEYFLIINPDTFISPEAISSLVSALDRDKLLGAVSPKILRWDFDSLKRTGQIDSCGLQVRSGLNFYDLGQGEEDSGQYDRANIIGPSGAAGLFRLSTLEAVKSKYGYFDERFFMYKEDCDLAYRLSLAKIKSILVPESIIYHDRSMAFYSSSLLAFWRNRRSLSRAARTWSFRNQHLLFYKFFWQENNKSRILLIRQVLLLFIYSLILEQFNLKEYKKIYKIIKY